MASRQTLCHRSFRFRNARIAPVSMRPRGLVSMPLGNPSAYRGTGVLSQVRAALDRTGAFQNRLTHALLPLLLRPGSAAGAPEPVLHDLLEEVRDALLLRPGSLLELILEVG